MPLGIIGGSGLYELDLEKPRWKKIPTPYGKVTAQFGSWSGKDVVFLPRHGRGHAVPPHRVNYRANIWGLWKEGVNRILAVGACGSMDQRIKPGHLVLFGQFLDFTKSRPSTFFEGGKRGVLHTDVTKPYCPELARIILQVAKRIGLRLHPNVTYVCTEGPRFETAAEIRAFRMLGGQVVGMTGVPECPLARELGMCYAGIGVVTNMAAGITERRLSHEEVLDLVSKLKDRIQLLLKSCVEEIPEDRTCSCQLTSQPIHSKSSS